MKFALACKNDHAFEGWFRSNEDFDTQQNRGLLECPVCGTNQVAKTLMAPSVSTGRTKDKIAVAAGHQAQQQIMTQMAKMAKELKSNADNVGEKFPEEARKIHYGETEKRSIYGTASSNDITELLDEGIALMPLPDVPEELN